MYFPLGDSLCVQRSGEDAAPSESPGGSPRISVGGGGQGGARIWQKTRRGWRKGRETGEKGWGTRLSNLSQVRAIIFIALVAWSMNFGIYLPACLSIYPSICLSVCLSVCLSICISVSLSIYRRAPGILSLVRGSRTFRLRKLFVFDTSSTVNPTSTNHYFNQFQLLLTQWFFINPAWHYDNSQEFKKNSCMRIQRLVSAKGDLFSSLRLLFRKNSIRPNPASICTLFF